MPDSVPLPSSEPPSSSEPSRHRRGLHLFVYAALLAGGLFLMFHPTILSGFERMQTDPGDTTLNHYFLEHTWKWLSDPNYPASFWSPRFYYPTPHVLTYSENLVGAAPLYWALRLEFGSEVSYQTWMMMLSAANFISMVIVLRWFGVNMPLAALGGFLFAFGLPRQIQLCHQQLLPHFMAPPAAWHFWKFLGQPQRRSWLLALLWTAWQMLASIHLGWFLLLALGTWFVAAACFDRAILGNCWGFIRKHAGFTLLSLAAWGLLLGLFFRNYYIGNADQRREYHEALYFMPGISNWLACPAHSLWELRLIPDDWVMFECRVSAGIGFIFLLLAAASARWLVRRGSLQRGVVLLSSSTVVAALLLALVATKFADHWSLWYFVYHGIPGANSIRAVGRVNFAILLLGLIGGTVAIQAILDTRVRAPAMRCTLSCILLALVVGEQIRFEADSFERAVMYGAADELSGTMQGAEAVYVGLEPQIVNGGLVQEVVVMWAGMKANVPVVNGYSGRAPHGYFPQHLEVSDDEVVRYLGQSWKGRLLIIRPGPPVRQSSVDVGSDR